MHLGHALTPKGAGCPRRLDPTASLKNQAFCTALTMFAALTRARARDRRLRATESLFSKMRPRRVCRGTMPIPHPNRGGSSPPSLRSRQRLSPARPPIAPGARQRSAGCAMRCAITSAAGHGRGDGFPGLSTATVPRWFLSSVLTTPADYAELLTCASLQMPAEWPISLMRMSDAKRSCKHAGNCGLCARLD